MASPMLVTIVDMPAPLAPADRVATSFAAESVDEDG